MGKSKSSGSRKSSRDIAREISNWLRAPVIPVNPAKETCVKGWPRLTQEKSLNRASLALFHGEYQNVGVVLGKVAGGLCSIDWDDHDCFDEFLKFNPRFTNTLASQASRAPNLWLRATGDFPRLTFLQKNGLDVGEWRADGAYTTIHGTHESGKKYHNNGKEPIEIAFSEIEWPKGIHPFNPDRHVCAPDVKAKFTEKTENTEETEKPEDVIVPHCAVCSVEAAVSLSTPTRVHSTNQTQFRFCQALKNFEQQRGSRLNTSELKNAFDRWYAAALPFLRPEQSKDRYFFEFMDRYQRTKLPLGASQILTHALKRAETSPPPKEAMQFRDPEIRRALSLLYHLQQETGAEPFFLSTRTCAGILGNEVSHTLVAQSPFPENLDTVLWV